MKVLSIAHSQRGGGIQTVFRINNSIKEENLEIRTAFEGDEISRPDIELKTMSSYKNPISKFLAYFHNHHNYSRLKSVLKNESFDIIHLHGTVSLGLSTLRLIHKSKREAKLVLTTHGYGLLCPVYSCFNYSQNKLCIDCIKHGGESRVIKNKCDRRGRIYSAIRYIDFVLKRLITNNYKIYHMVITPSQYSLDLHERSRHSFTNLRLVPNPIEEEAEEIDLSKKENWVTFMGRFSPEKNVGLLIDAAGQILEIDKYKDLQVNILGAGPLKKDYEAKIKNLAIENQVYLSDKFLDKEELKYYLEKSKILVLPSISPETFGLVLLEGVRHGLVPLCQNIGAQAENLGLIGLGYTYDRNKPEDLKEAIIKALDHYPNLPEKIKEANQTIDELFSAEIYKKNILSAYRDLL